MIFQFRDNEKVLQTPSMINKNKSTLRYLKIKPVKIKDKKKILKVGRKDYLQLSSVTQFMSDSLGPHGLQHARPA